MSSKWFMFSFTNRWYQHETDHNWPIFSVIIVKINSYCSYSISILYCVTSTCLMGLYVAYYLIVSVNNMVDAIVIVMVSCFLIGFIVIINSK